MKLGDFGLAIDIGTPNTDEVPKRKRMHRRNSMPEPHTAPEVNNSSHPQFPEVSTKNDIHCFGVLLYEVFSKGADAKANSRSRSQSNDAILGPPWPPKSVSMRIQGLMKDCWSWEPASRPGYLQIAEELVKEASECQVPVISHQMPGMAVPVQLLDVHCLNDQPTRNRESLDSYEIQSSPLPRNAHKLSVPPAALNPRTILQAAYHLSR